MQLTNAQIGDLVDALRFAVMDRQLYLCTHFSRVCIKDRGRGLTGADKTKYDECIAQIKRYRALRRYLLQF